MQLNGTSETESSSIIEADAAVVAAAVGTIRCWCCSSCAHKKKFIGSDHNNRVEIQQWLDNNVESRVATRKTARVRWEDLGDGKSDEENSNCMPRVVPSDTAEQQIHGLFVDAFVYNCRLEHMIQVMGYHPQYLSAFLAMHHTVLQGADGPLPYDQRHFIGIMASSRHQCSYLVHLQSIEFQLQDGDERWLEGLQCKHIPRKLKNLSELNKLMAHRPWLINKSHIAKLLRGEDSWSLSELMHAVVLLAHFHSLSSFIYGCGISAEVDQQMDAPEVGSPLPADDIKPQSRKGSSASLNDGVNGDVEVLMEQMKKLTEEEQCEEDEVTQEELLQRFNFVESQCAELPASSTHVTQKGDMIRFIDDPEFTYQDFAKCQNAQAIFRAQDYSWEDHGFFQADSLYKDIATLLDEKFKVAFNLTYFTMGDNKHVDTTSFRRAVWYYIQCLFGIRHDDYDYGKISRLLERHLKTYIKIVTCYPETVTNKDYDSFMKGFKHSEKVHVNLMLLEARLQAELLYVLRAITDWQKQRN